MDMKIVEETPELTHVALAGELDGAGHHRVSTKFIGYITARMKPTIVDMSGVTFMASVGMGMLANLSSELKEHGVTLVLLSPQDAVDKALKEMSWDKVMPLVHTREEAIEALGASD